MRRDAIILKRTKEAKNAIDQVFARSYVFRMIVGN